MEPLVSVIIPAYNTEIYIDKCLKSVLNQSYKNIEIIVVDDGSEDNLYTKLQQYNKEYYNIKIFTQTNSGAASARNFGLKHSQGELITFLDSDDWFTKNSIKKLVEKLMNENSDAVIPSRFFEFSNEIIRKKMFGMDVKFNNPQEFIMNIMIGKARAWRVSSVMYRADIINSKKINFPEGYIAEDFIFNLRYLKNSSKISILNEETLVVRKRHNSVTARYNPNLLDVYLFIDKEVIQFLNEIDYDYKKAELASDSLLSRNIILFILNEVSYKNPASLLDKLSQIKKALKKERVKKAFNRKKFIEPYWSSKLKKKFIKLLRLLIKYDFYILVFLISYLTSNLKEILYRKTLKK